MTNPMPRQDERYRDNGRRLITLGTRTLWAALAPLRADELDDYPGSTHQIVFRVTPGAACRAGMVIAFDGTDYRVTALTDPFAGDTGMRRKFTKLIVRKA